MLGAIGAAFTSKRLALAPKVFSVAWTAACSSRGHTITRNPDYNEVTNVDIDFFRGILGDKDVITDAEALEPCNRDWLGKYVGSSRLALKPRDKESISQILAYCSVKRLPVVPQGGNTGLVGGSTPVFDEIILSLANMNKIRSIDSVSGVLVCEAGCILQSLDEALADQGLMMPLDLGAKGSCFIGGNVATNAGGLRLLRYGSLHGSVLGLEVVTPDGTILDLLRTLRKDNTGADLKQLFIGSEGTLGVITAVSIQCAPKPQSVQVAFLEVPSFEAVQEVLRAAKVQLGEILSAAEFLDSASMDLVTSQMEGVRNPLGESGDQAAAAAAARARGGSVHGGRAGPFYMVVETHGSNTDHDAAKLNHFLEAMMGCEAVSNGTLAESSTQADGIWKVREGITEALTKRGAVYKYDLSMPVHEMYCLVEVMRQRLQHLPEVLVVGYGHVGDGNLHLNISYPGAYQDSLLQLIEPFVYEWTAERGGSISAEHGLGLTKAKYIGYSKVPEAVELMWKLKDLMDPHGILNPYKVLPPPGTTIDEWYCEVTPKA